ncbi:ABC transporter ATP-binding protein [Runella salmonicolor]|uniref:ABC transporter ATP-binding protein/permease n=1 Tax=Runella salmonicolor TaxID=2950278 RepID=A0ABT1FJR0_9BACT|nr:ABC transporter ATP-binding protein [Runella salmonicolor]MCP1381755.1 ABC transporter ATP-binding protein/permease [Runella salmonicolor]
MQNPYISLLRIAWRYARQQKGRYLLVYGLFVLANIVYALNPLLYGWFIEAIQKEGTGVIKHVWMYAGGYLFLMLLEWAFHGPARVMERELAFNLSRNFLDELYHQALHLPVRWHQDHHSGATINRIRKAYEALRDFFQNGFMFFHAFAKFIFSFGAILYFSPFYGGIGVLIGVLTVWIIFKFDKPFIKALDETNEKEHVVSSTLFDSLSNIITVITLRLEKRMQNSLMGKVAEIFPPFRRTVVINEWKWFVASVLIGIIYVVVAIGYVYENYVPNTVFLVGGLVTLLGYVNQFTSVFQDVAWQYTEITRYNTDVQTARAIGESYSQQHRAESEEMLPTAWQTIQIQHLNFSHQELYDAEHKAHSLHNLSLNIKRGQRVAFIGESGSGKSTLLALLRGLYQAESGLKVNIDGKEFTGLGIINDTVTLFPQEPEIFENTIEYNITLGLPFEETDIMMVCATAHFAEVIAQLPNGLQSNIQEKGVNLSGGQKQRLALARGVLAARSSDIVLLDEPTSSVDPKTEVQIYDRLFEEFSGKAIVSTLHRLHLLTKFDYVYILQNGRIADQGTFEYLRQNSAIFQDLWKHQEKIQG